MSHTPGPWHWGETWKEWDANPWDPREEFSGPKYGDIALHAEKRDVIPILIDHSNIEWDSANGLGDLKPADRALIAAAPEMLEALKSLENALVIPKAIWKMVKDAIAKAEGH